MPFYHAHVRPGLLDLAGRSAFSNEETLVRDDDPGLPILREIGADWSVEEIELDEPKAGEILVKTTAAGMCHSDEHAHDGTMPVPLPIIGGHEGAGAW